MNNKLLKTIVFVFVICMAYACTSPVERQIDTVVFDGDRQPPIVGGEIYGFCIDSIYEQGVLLSADSSIITINAIDSIVSKNHKKSEWENTIRKWRIYRCSDDTHSEQFYTFMKWLEGNTTYFTRAYIKYADGKTYYGDIEKIHTQDYKRNIYMPQSFANVYFGNESLSPYPLPEGMENGQFDLFDHFSDELINWEENGFYWSRNESMEICRYSHNLNTCYKFINQWNYLQNFYQHFLKGRPNIEVTNTPIITLKDKTMTIECESEDATIYYAIDRNFPDLSGNIQTYQDAIPIDTPCVIGCYAINKIGFLSEVNYYFVTEENIGKR